MIRRVISNEVYTIQGMFTTGCQNASKLALGDFVKATSLEKTNGGTMIKFKGHVEMGIMYCKSFPCDMKNGFKTSNNLNLLDELTYRKGVLLTLMFHKVV